MSDKKAVWDEVIEDMRKRDQLGEHRYETRLYPFNGRKALQDAYEEALDLAVYLKQELIERRCLRCGNSPCKRYLICILCKSHVCLEWKESDEK